MDKLFPIILIILNVLASIVYASYSNWRLAVYWLAAAILTTCVTI